MLLLPFLRFCPYYNNPSPYPLFPKSEMIGFLLWYTACFGSGTGRKRTITKKEFEGIVIGTLTKGFDSLPKDSPFLFPKAR